MYRLYLRNTASLSLASVSIYKSRNRTKADLHVPYLIVGSGTSGYYAMRTIRYLKPDSRVLLITDDEHPPYKKEIFTKEAWFSLDFSKNLTYRSLSGNMLPALFQPREFYKSAHDLESSGAMGDQAVMLQSRVKHIHPKDNIVVLESGEVISYNKCCLSVGQVPNVPKVLLNADIANKIHTLRTIGDFQRFQEAALSSRSVAIVGANPSSYELAVTLKTLFSESEGIDVHLITESERLFEFLPHSVESWLVKKIDALFSRHFTLSELRSATDSADFVTLEFSNESINVDDIVLTVNEPATKFLNDCIEIDSSKRIIANSELQVCSDLYSCGSSTSFYQADFGRRCLDYPNNSKLSGICAGINMIGESAAYSDQPYFSIDFGDVFLDSLGLTSEQLKHDIYYIYPESEDKPQISNPDDAIKCVVAYFSDEGVLVGVTMVNFPFRLHAIRRMISEKFNSDQFFEYLPLLLGKIDKKLIQPEENDPSNSMGLSMT